MPERPKGTGCKPVGFAYEGSNPSRPTMDERPGVSTPGRLPFLVEGGAGPERALAGVGRSEHVLHHGDVEPAPKLAADLLLHPDDLEPAGLM